MIDVFKEGRGGKRAGAGNPGTKRVKELRKPTTFTILPSLMALFRKKHGCQTSRRVEELIRADIAEPKRQAEDAGLDQDATNA